MTTDPEVKRLAREIAQLTGRVNALSSSRLSNSSLEDSGVNSYDADGNLAAQIGKLYDERQGIVSLVGPRPPTPGSFTATPVPVGVKVRWEGGWAAGPMEVAASTHKLVEVHASADPNFSGLFFDTYRGEFNSARGGELVVPADPSHPDDPDGGLYFRLVARDLAGKASDPSVVVGPVSALKIAQDAIEIDFDQLGGNTIHRGDTEPAGSHKLGDLWLQTPNNVPHRWEGDPAAWVPSRDQGIAEAIQTAFDAEQAASAAEQAGIDAIAAASQATTTANDAATAAQNAATAAQNALTNAQTAYELAEQAEATGSTASGAAAAAQTAADEAADNAAAALQQAQAAGTDAGAAQTAADQAAAAATAAQTAADQAGTAAAQADADAAAAAAEAAQALADAAAAQQVADQIASRGTDLVINGTGILGNNTNFSRFVFDPTDTPIGGGSFDLPDASRTQYLSDEPMPIDLSRKYKLTAQVKQKDPDSPDSRFYLGVAPLDPERRAISTTHWMHFPDTTTTLAAPLNQGDTVVYLTSAENWRSVGSPAHQRRLIFWNYEDGNGRVWPPGTYSRLAWGSDSWEPGAVDYSANTITLREPWTGLSMPAGSSVSNGSAGSNYPYIAAANAIAPPEWTEFSGTIQGPHTDPTVGPIAWPPGTAYAKVLILSNYGTPAPTSRQSFAAFSFSDATAAAQEAAAAGVAATQALAVANTKITTFRQDSSPTSGMSHGDFWIDSNDGNKLYRYENGAWVLVQDVGIQTAIENAATAQAVADGKMRIFVADAAPTGLTAADLGDLWINPAEDNRSYTWDGDSWEARLVGNNAIQPKSLVASDVIATGTITAALFEAILVLASTIVAGSPTAAHVEIDAGGIRLYAVNPDGAVEQTGSLGTGDDGFALLDPVTKRTLTSVTRDGIVTPTFSITGVDENGDGLPESGFDIFGREFFDYLDPLPQGLLAMATYYPTDGLIVSGVTSEHIIGELSFTALRGRAYSIRQDGLHYSSSNGRIRGLLQMRGTEGGATPTTTNGQVYQAHWFDIPRTNEGMSAAPFNFTKVWSTTQDVEVRLVLVVGRQNGDSAGSSIVARTYEVHQSFFSPLRWSLHDEGLAVPDTFQLNNGTGAPSTGGTAPESAKKRYTTTWQAAWEASFEGNGSKRSDTDLMQGFTPYYPGGGNQRGLAGLVGGANYSSSPSEIGKTIVQATGSATVEKIEIKLRCNHSHSNAGGTARIGFHGQLLEPSASPAAAYEVFTTYFKKGESKWITRPASEFANWKNGTYRGVTVGPNGDYMRFDGVGSERPAIRITYVR